jgi:hypothetical protein
MVKEKLPLVEVSLLLSCSSERVGASATTEILDGNSTWTLICTRKLQISTIPVGLPTSSTGNKLVLKWRVSDVGRKIFKKLMRLTAIDLVS